MVGDHRDIYIDERPRIYPGRMVETRQNMANQNAQASYNELASLLSPGSGVKSELARITDKRAWAPYALRQTTHANPD